jgi:hypothetical protein
VTVAQKAISADKPAARSRRGAAHQPRQCRGFRDSSFLGRDPPVALVPPFAGWTSILRTRRHALITVDDHGHASIRDENSTNGTFVNGDRLLPGTDVRLVDGDTVRLAADVTGEVTLPKQEPDPAMLT